MPTPCLTGSPAGSAGDFFWTTRIPPPRALGFFAGARQEADPPAGLVGFRRGIAKRDDLRRRHLFVAGAQLANGAGRKWFGYLFKIGWPLAALRRDDDPAIRHRIF